MAHDMNPRDDDPHAECAHEIDRLSAELAAAEAKLKDLEQTAGNLLAVIHGDGGHYIDEHGWEKAVQDATDKWYALAEAERKLGVAVAGLVMELGEILARNEGRTLFPNSKDHYRYQAAERIRAVLAQLRSPPCPSSQPSSSPSQESGAGSSGVTTQTMTQRAEKAGGGTEPVPSAAAAGSDGQPMQIGPGPHDGMEDDRPILPAAAVASPAPDPRAGLRWGVRGKVTGTLWAAFAVRRLAEVWLAPRTDREKLEIVDLGGEGVDHA